MRWRKDWTLATRTGHVVPDHGTSKWLAHTTSHGDGQATVSHHRTVTTHETLRPGSNATRILRPQRRSMTVLRPCPIKGL